MAEKKSRIATGCGIGCGLFAIILIVLGVLVYNFVKDTVDQVKQIEEVSSTLKQKFGNEEDFTPNFEQPQFEERLSMFLDIRDTLNIRSEKFYEEFGGLVDSVSGQETEKSFLESIGLVNTGISMVPEMIKYYSNRNTLLLDYGMSLGEYYFFYFMSYYSFLKQSPGDGPPIRIFEDDHSKNEGITFDIDSKDQKEEDIIAIRNFELSQKVNYLFKNHLENFMAKDSAGEFSNDVKIELEKLKQNRLRIPWQENLPKSIEPVFRSLELKIKKTYVKLVNPLEINSIQQKLKR